MDRIKPTPVSTASACILFAVLCLQSAGVSADTTLSVDASISNGSCDVMVVQGETPTQGVDNSPYTMEVGTVDPALLVRGGVTALRENTAVTLVMKCGGSMTNGVTPTLTVAGTPLGGSAEGAYLFQGNAQSTIDPRVGAVLSTQKGTQTIEPWDSDNYLQSGQDIVLNPPGTGAGNNANGYWTTVYAGMSCGDVESCDEQNQGALTEGDLYATVTFAFNYK